MKKQNNYWKVFFDHWGQHFGTGNDLYVSYSTLDYYIEFIIKYKDMDNNLNMLFKNYAQITNITLFKNINILEIPSYILYENKKYSIINIYGYIDKSEYKINTLVLNYNIKFEKLYNKKISEQILIKTDMIIVNNISTSDILNKLFICDSKYIFIKNRNTLLIKNNDKWIIKK